MSVCGVFKIVSHTTLTSGAASTETAVVPSGITWVRVVSTQAFYCDIGVGATAAITDVYCSANREQFFRINAGERVAVLQVSSGATVYITYMSN